MDENTMSAEPKGDFEFFDRDGAKFRRPKGQPGGVTDVLHGKAWTPYTGDRTRAYLFGERIADPLAPKIPAAKA